jgi:hypothetical protein
MLRCNVENHLEEGFSDAAAGFKVAHDFSFDVALQSRLPIMATSALIANNPDCR